MYYCQIVYTKNLVGSQVSKANFAVSSINIIILFKCKKMNSHRADFQINE